MNILFVTPTWPDPPNSGAKARMASILNVLKQTNSNVTLLYVDVNVGHPDLKNTKLPVNEIVFQPFRSGDVRYRFKKKLYGLTFKFSPAWVHQRISLTAARQKYRTVNTHRYADPVIIQKIRQLIDEKKIDAIWFNYAFWGYYPIDQLDVLKIVDTHDLLHQRLKIAMEKQVAPRGIYATLEEEKKWLLKFDRVIAIQEKEAEKIRQLGVNPVYTIGHVISFHKKKFAPRKFIVGFIGSINQVNLTSLAYIENHIFNHLSTEERSSFQFWVAGSVARASTKADKYTYQVDTIDEFFGNINLLLNPVLEGTGLKIKNIEALSFGVPVITTPKGAEGLSDCPDPLIVKNSSKDMAAELMRIISNPQLRTNYIRKSAQFISDYNEKQKTELAAVLRKS